MRLPVLLVAGACGLAETGNKIRMILTMLHEALDEANDVNKQKTNELTQLNCIADKLKKKNTAEIQELEEKNEDLDTELESLESMTLTDEGKIFREKIHAKDKEIEGHEKDMADKKQKHKDHMEDLASGVSALVEAKKAVSPKTFLIQHKALGALVMKSTALKDALEELAAPKKYKTKMGPVLDLINKLMLQMKTEISDGEAEYAKDLKADEEILKTLNSERDSLAKEAEEGKGEAAAKKAKENELKEAKKNNDDLIKELTKQRDDAVAAAKKASGEFTTFSEENTETRNALEEAIGYLEDPDNRDLFSRVRGRRNQDAKASFLQRSAQMSRAEAREGFKALLDMIKNTKKELDEEKEDIDSAIKDCSKKSKASLNANLQTSLKMDSHVATIKKNDEIIEKEQETQKEITQKIADTVEMLEEATENWNKLKAEHIAMQDDLKLAEGVCDKVKDALEGKKGLERLFSMMDHIKADLEKERKDSENTQKEGQADYDELAKSTGTETEGDDACDGDTVICKLEKSRDASKATQTKAEEEKGEANVALGTETETLENGLGEFQKRQRDCDESMVLGPGRKDEIEDEITALNQALNVMENLDIEDIESKFAA